MDTSLKDGAESLKIREDAVRIWDELWSTATSMGPSGTLRQLWETTHLEMSPICREEL